MAYEMGVFHIFGDMETESLEKNGNRLMDLGAGEGVGLGEGGFVRKRGNQTLQLQFV